MIEYVVAMDRAIVRMVRARVMALLHVGSRMIRDRSRLVISIRDIYNCKG